MHDKMGLLVPPDDPAALAEAVNLLLTDQKKANRLAVAAYSYALDEMTTDSIMLRYIAFYNRLFKSAQ